MKAVEAEKVGDLVLHELCADMPGLSNPMAQVLCEAAAVCFEQNQHKPGVCLHLSGDSASNCNLIWPAVTQQQKQTHADIPEATERGACGVAISVIRNLTGLLVVERSAKGTGFDYWLGTEDDNALPFVNNKRLEVSGILSATASQLARRIKTKKAQMDPSDGLAEGLVAVVDFGRPQAHVETK